MAPATEALAERFCGASPDPLVLYKNPMECRGDVDHDEAVKCANRFQQEARAAEQLARDRQTQAKCLCELLIRVTNKTGRYSLNSGSCDVY